MHARAGWVTMQRVARLAEESSRTELRAAAGDITRTAAATLRPEWLDAMKRRIERRPPNVFVDYARDAAEAFGDAEAAAPVHRILSAMIEGIRIVDDIQDGEAVCLAADIGASQAMQVAFAAIAFGLELTADLPLDEERWRAAAIAIGRGVRETAAGQILESEVENRQSCLSIEAGQAGLPVLHYWQLVDSKTPPLVATALEVGALAAGASPEQAAALTRLAIPLGRLLQISDDCNDALGPDATDWRTPHLNLLMLYGLSGPNGNAVAELLRNGHDPASLRAAQLLLLRDGALAYALHAQTATLGEFESRLAALELPHPEPFKRFTERYRLDLEALLRRSRAA